MRAKRAIKKKIDSQPRFFELVMELARLIHSSSLRCEINTVN